MGKEEVNKEGEKKRWFSEEQYEMLLRCSEKKDMTEWNKWRKESDIGEKGIRAFEKRARNLRRSCIRGFIFAIAILGFGTMVFVEGFEAGDESMEESIKRYVVDAEQIPSGTERG